MMTQTDLFAPHDEITEAFDPEHEATPVRSAITPIAVPCGFRDRHNNPCQLRGNWPIMDGSKQMLCRDRPMVHCDPACFRAAPLPSLTMLAPTTSYGATRKANTAATNSIAAVYDASAAQSRL